MIRQNGFIKIICCFCGKKINLSVIEEHIKLNCHPEYEEITQDKVDIPINFLNLFSKINEGDYNIVVKEKVFEQFNKNAFKQYEHFYIQIRSVKNTDKYLNLLKRNIPDLDNNEIIIQKDEIILKELFDIFDKYLNKVPSFNSKLNFKRLICYFCNITVELLTYHKHVKFCFQEHKIIEKGSMITKPKFALLIELFKQIMINKIDICYVTFIIHQYNINCREIFEKHYDPKIDIKRVETNKEENLLVNYDNIEDNIVIDINNESLEIDSDSKFNEPNNNENLIENEVNQHEISNNIEEIENKTENINTNNEINCSPLDSHTPEKNTDNLWLKCYFCGNISGINYFENHFNKCKEEFSLSEKSMTENIVEPPFVAELIKKIREGSEIEEDINKYNSFADSIYMEISEKTCEKCNEKVSKEMYELHIQNCVIDKKDDCSLIQKNDLQNLEEDEFLKDLSNKVKKFNMKREKNEGRVNFKIKNK